MTTKQTGRFCRRVVVCCLIMSAVVTLAVLAISWRAGYIDAGTVGVLMGLWGGELGLCCLKRLVGDKSKPAAKPPATLKEDTTCSI